MKISGCIITKNEETHIADAIRSIDFADEIIVVDSGSTDKTVSIAESLGARVIHQDWLGFGKQKQFATDKCKHDWIFSLDADERVSPELSDFVKSLKIIDEESLSTGYRFSRLTIYIGAPVRHGGWYPDWQLRFFDRRRARWKDLSVHESVELIDGGKIEKIQKDIVHYSVSSIEEHERMIASRYAPLAAQKMIDSGKTSSPIRIFFSPIVTFLQTYLLKLGFLDGWRGICIASFAAHHTFLKYSIVYEHERSKKATKQF